MFTSNNYEVGTLAVDGWAVTFGTARRDSAGPQPALHAVHIMMKLRIDR